MKAVYPAIFIPEAKGEYSVIFPDLAGCATCGDNLEHALTMAEEALGLYLAALEEDRHKMPLASDIKALEAKQGEFINYIMVEVNQYRRNKSVNTMVTIPAWLKEAGERAHINFSGVLQDALKTKLGF